MQRLNLLQDLLFLFWKAFDLWKQKKPVKEEGAGKCFS